MFFPTLIAACLNFFSATGITEDPDRNALYIQPLGPLATWGARMPIQWSITYERIFSGNMSWNLQPSIIRGQSSDDHKGEDATQRGGGLAISFKKYPLRDSAEAIYIGPKLEVLHASYDSPSWVERQEYTTPYGPKPRTFPARSATVTDTRLMLMLGYRSKWEYFCAYLDAGVGVGKASLTGDPSVFPDSYRDYTSQSFRYDFDFGMGIPF
ncbi:MAG: hypothetical protein IPO40_20330 [Fibrobacteres bacterium]|nr:hypothetical protein [Fibrobacterota bacterium]